MKNKLVLLLSLFALTSCGSKVNELGNVKLDHSATWNDNYYTYFDASLKKLPNTVVELNKETNIVFTSYEDSNFALLEANKDVWSYSKDFDEDVGYGPNMRLAQYNEAIKEGFISKLYDGQMFCHGYYEAARVQIKEEEGISASLKGSLKSADYLFLNFKSAHNFKAGIHLDPHVVDITLTISFYTKDKATSYSYLLSELPTNQGETYIFYGFSTKELDLSNVNAYSISYHIEKDEYNESLETKLEHALLLYEFGFKNPIY